MTRYLRATALVVATLCGAAPAVAQPGPIVAVGGGGTTDEIASRTLALAGGGRAVVAVLPQSSAVENAGTGSVRMWLDAGAAEAFVVEVTDVTAARAALERATLIWMPGGDQNRFMRALEGTGLAEVILARHRSGAVVGGTSAGAAVLSDAMITGTADLTALTAGATVLAKGLGVWPDVLVDQHFLTRQRANRLLSAVLDRPSLVGVGIDEATAVIARGLVLEVVGRGVVVVMDPRGARVSPAESGHHVAGTGIVLHVLRPGMTIDLEPRK
jgi:cyanophycinase